jgi:hypothetical protein
MELLLLYYMRHKYFFEWKKDETVTEYMASYTGLWQSLIGWFYQNKSIYYWPNIKTHGIEELCILERNPIA